MKLNLSRIAEFVGASMPAVTNMSDSSAMALGYSIDSRTVRPGELFFAVKGERLDGHDFVEQSLNRGALAAVVEKSQLARYSNATPLLAVEDTLVALQTLATAVRKKWGKTAIGITGSMGKTTTKEALSHLLSVKYRVHRTKGNFNNHFGLPLGLLTLEPEHDLAVVEMGMSNAGEISTLARIALPNQAVITNVAPVHLENFDSLAGIARAKYELIEALPNNGTAVLNADDEYVSQFGRDFKGKVIRFGCKPIDVRAENIELLGTEGARFDLISHDVRQTMQSPLMGKHNIYNVLAACALALEHGITPSEIASALPTLQPADKRGQVVKVGNIAVLYDCYNSSPKALMAAVDTLAAMSGNRHIVVAGEMLELGDTGEELHRECGRYIAEAQARRNKIDFLLGVRGLARPLVEAAQKAGMEAAFVATPEEAGDWLAHEAREGDVVLLKASRGVKLEKALETWLQQIGNPDAHASGN
jgi:UDP-N-acetylmuramoyl-tripeptide--D-alanyl-D-alanine ligase